MRNICILKFDTNLKISVNKASNMPHGIKLDSSRYTTPTPIHDFTYFAYFATSRTHAFILRILMIIANYLHSMYSFVQMPAE